MLIQQQLILSHLDFRHDLISSVKHPQIVPTRNIQNSSDIMTTHGVRGLVVVGQG